MRIILVFLFSFLFIGVFAGGTFLVYSNYFGTSILETQVLNHLESVAQSGANRINSFINERKADAIFLSETEGVRASFDEEVSGDVELMEDVVKTVAEQTAIEVEKYILDHPEMTLEELQEDPDFKKIAIRRIGGEGYTVFYGPETFINYLHFDPEKTGEGHDHVWNNPTYVQLAKILSAANKTEKDVSGFYQLLERGGEREKFMYIRMLPGRYFDNNLRLSIKAIIYIDDFGKTIKVASDIDKELEDFQKNKGYNDIILIDAEGNVVWTANQENDLGTNLETGVYNDTNLAEVYRVAKEEFNIGISSPRYYEASGLVAVFITKPIFDIDAETEKKTLIGILALQLDNNKIKELVELDLGVEDSGEIYVVTRDGHHITPLKYEEIGHKGEVSHSISSDQIEDCLKDYGNYYLSQTQQVEQVSKSGIYKNYAGIDVFGAHQYILQSGWCVLAEINEKVILSSRFNKLSQFERYVMYMFAMIIIIILISAIGFSCYFQLKKRRGR